MPGFGDINSDECKFHFRDQPSNPREAEALFKKISKGGAVKICSAGNVSSIFFIASDIYHKNGISYFYLTQVFKAENDEDRWEFIPPVNSLYSATRMVYMCPDSEECLRHDDKRFVQTEGISVGVFRKFDACWNKILSSEDAFNKASEHLSIFSKLSSDVKRLKKVLFKSDHKSRASTTLVRFVQGKDSPRYGVHITAESQMWNIEFDFYNEEIKFEEIASVIP